MTAAAPARPHEMVAASNRFRIGGDRVGEWRRGGERPEVGLARRVCPTRDCENRDRRSADNAQPPAEQSSSHEGEKGLETERGKERQYGSARREAEEAGRRLRRRIDAASRWRLHPPQRVEEPLPWATGDLAAKSLLLRFHRLACAPAEYAVGGADVVSVLGEQCLQLATLTA